MRQLADVPFTCSHCGNVERFPGSATIAEVAVEPCAKCGKLGKLPPRLRPTDPTTSGPICWTSDGNGYESTWEGDHA